MTEYPVAENVMKACCHCATISRHKYRADRGTGVLPNADEPTATVTFIKFKGNTYAFTARHVITAFDRLRELEGSDFEGYLCPVEPGVTISGPFITPPAPLMDVEPDIAICPVSKDLPDRIGKSPFFVHEEGDAKWPVTHALAVGFPTASKEDRLGNGGTRLAMECVHALAEGTDISRKYNEVQFFSEISERPECSSLNGMSGGPVFWSDEIAHGLIGLVKEALDVVPKEGEGAISLNPRVHFLCQRVDFDIMSRWISYVDENWQSARDKINVSIKSRAVAISYLGNCGETLCQINHSPPYGCTFHLW